MAVRVLVGADQQRVFDRLARLWPLVGLDEAGEARAKVVGKGLELLVGAPVRQQRDRLARRRQQLCGRRGCGLEANRLAGQQRLRGARAFEQLGEVAALVADPGAVYLRVVAGGDARDACVLAGGHRLQAPLRAPVPDVDGAAALAARADRGSRLQVPDPGAIEEGPRQQCADRAQVDDVVRVVVPGEGAVARGAHQADVRALLDAQAVGAGHFPSEADAARAEDAALVVEHDALGQQLELGRAHLLVGRDGAFAIVAVVIVLQRALAGLVADAAVHRVVERQQLQDGLALLAHRRRVGEYLHALLDGHVAGDVQPAVIDLDHADAAVAGHRQRRVPAEMRDLDAGRARRLDHGLVRTGFDRLPVYENGRHSRFPSYFERLCSMQ